MQPEQNPSHYEAPVETTSPYENAPVAETPAEPTGGMFAGRINRLGFFLGLLSLFGVWIAVLLVYIVATNLVNLGSTPAGSEDLFAPRNPLVAVINTIMFITIAILMVVDTVVRISLFIRRLHDVGQSGLLILLSFIPMVGFFLYLYLQFVAGDVQPNKYGPPTNDHRLLRLWGFKKSRSTL